MSGARAAPPPDRAAAIRRVLLGLLVANLAVVAVKVVIGVKTGSLSVLGDAIHSSVDALNNILFMVLMRLADSPPDADHPYGHGKFESVGALFILVFLSVTCFELLKTSLTGLLRHGAVVPQIRGVHLALLASTLLINLLVTFYERRRGVELASDLLVADAAHTRVDVFISAGVLAGAVLMRFGVRYIDAAIAIIIVVLVVRVGWEIIRDSIPSLVDQAAREPEAIRRNAEEVPGVRAASSIRSRAAAGVVFAELTIGVDGTMTVGAAHEIADAVEARLKQHLQLDQVVVHIEPC
jgi:cation diffusion facilitator family transporter